MKYLVRFMDCTDLEDAKEMDTGWRDPEFAVNEFLDEYWHEYECPEAPFDVGMRLANDKFEPIGEEKIYRIGEIEYTPHFCYEELPPTKTEPKTDS